MAQEWYKANKNYWSAEYAKMTWSRLENNLLPWIGNTPIDEIEPPLLLKQIRRIENRGATDTAHRIAQLAGAIFRFAIAAGSASRNPAADIKGALKREPVRHFPALTEPEDIKKLLQAIDSYAYSLIVGTALKVSALTFLRPGAQKRNLG
ncbi:MAG: tyrosine-type recombinase/integrase [Thermodesulfobacteriota bacterium]